ncbi:MAG: hypothetical protein NT016_01600 [Candidatus Aenigmarchaeota archaeon]|nr:hypothetical protein [Candidatus Aenigmarchaeota archaeon]
MRTSRPIQIPSLSNPKLAYETGVHIGDGTMVVCQNSHYVIYYGDNRNERPYFKNVIIPYLESLYGFDKMKLRNFQNTCYVRIYSKNLVKFKSEKLGLPIGPKDKMSLATIKIFSKNKQLVSNLIAGVFDTDGCVKFNRKKYPRLTIGLKHEKIIRYLKFLLEDSFGIKSTFYKCEFFDKRVDKKEVCWRFDINGFENFEKFMAVIPIRNPKNIERANNIIRLGANHADCN